LTDASSDRTAPELVLIFDNARPLAAADLGDLFSAMARDYRLATRGRTLVVARLETGSLYAYVRDALHEFAPYSQYALETVKAFKGIKEFAQTLTGLFGRVKEHPGTLGELKRRRRVGAKSIEAIVKIAAVSHSVVELRHETSDGEIIDLKVTPVEAIHIREHSAQPSSLPFPPTPTLIPLTGGNAGPPTSLPIIPDLFQPSDYADSLVRLYDRRDAKGGSATESDIRALVAVLANSLISVGHGSLISVIASDLEGRGYSNLAQILRAEAQSQNRGPAP
jgi:hypothetical protein